LQRSNLGLLDHLVGAADKRGRHARAEGKKACPRQIAPRTSETWNEPKADRVFAERKTMGIFAEKNRLGLLLSAVSLGGSMSG
jgi:hypothetical protein